MTAEELKQIFGRAVPDRGKLQEIRLRAGKPVLVFMDGREYMVGREGLLEPDADLSPVLADPALIREILGIFSRHSLYAFEDEIRQGFLTIEGGHRVGIAGKAVTEGSGLRTIRDISSLNIRLAHEKPGCGDPVLPWLYENGRLQNTLILSPPGVPLEAGDHKNLLALGENLGYAHKDMQERTLLFYLEETDGSIGFLKREMESRTKLYRCLGMAAGLFLMVVMA